MIACILRRFVPWLIRGTVKTIVQGLGFLVFGLVLVLVVGFVDLVMDINSHCCLPLCVAAVGLAGIGAIRDAGRRWRSIRAECEDIE